MGNSNDETSYQILQDGESNPRQKTGKKIIPTNWMKLKPTSGSQCVEKVTQRMGWLNLLKKKIAAIDCLFKITNNWLFCWSLWELIIKEPKKSGMYCWGLWSPGYKWKHLEEKKAQGKWTCGKKKKKKMALKCFKPCFFMPKHLSLGKG